MANLEREYIVPLRKEWLKCVMHKRAKKAMRAVKEFLAHHMKVEEKNVRLSIWINEEVWGRGIKNPPAKIKVKVSKDDKGIVRAELFELSERAKKIEAKTKERADKINKVKESKKEAEAKAGASESKDSKEKEKIEAQVKEAIKEEEKGKAEEKKEEEKIMHKLDRPEEPKTTQEAKDPHQHEKTKPFRTALRK